MIDDKITINEAIKSLNQQAYYRITGTSVDLDVATIEWLEGTIPISKLDIQSEVTRLQEEYDALAWKRSREENYPSIAELTVALYDTDDKADIEAKRAAVKAKYPKPS